METATENGSLTGPVGMKLVRTQNPAPTFSQQPGTCLPAHPIIRAATGSLLPASSALCSPHPLDRLRGDERLILPLDTSLPFSLDTAQGPEKPFCAHGGSGRVLAAHGHAAAHIRRVLNAGPGVLAVGFRQGH